MPHKPSEKKGEEKQKNRSLIDLLAAHAQDSTGQGICRLPQFLALKEPIEEALGKGWSMKAIWKILYAQKRFTGRYNCFAAYVRKHIRKDGLPALLDAAPERLPQHADGQAKPPQETTVDVISENVWKPETEAGVFDFNPVMTSEQREEIFGQEKSEKEKDSHG